MEEGFETPSFVAEAMKDRRRKGRQGIAKDDEVWGLEFLGRIE
jgi:hypothetical protein